MEDETQLNNLQDRNDSLKSMLIHEQIKSQSYSFKYFKKYSSMVLNEYKKHLSFFKVSSTVGISQKEIMNWYIQGQRGNPVFRGFYLAIEEINKNGEFKREVLPQKVEIVENKQNIFEEEEYVISRYGDGWSYKTYVDGEKIFIISNDLETLKMKVKKQHLPLDEQ